LNSGLKIELAHCRRTKAVRESVADPTFYRDKAEQALRLARGSTDLVLIDSLKEMAREYLARADAIDGVALGQDPDDDDE
jgi:hypothetical protein